MELPRLQPLYEEYRDQGFEIIAIETKGQTDRATKFIERAVQSACVMSPIDAQIVSPALDTKS